MFDKRQISYARLWIRNRVHLRFFGGAFLVWLAAFLIQYWVRPNGIDDVFNPLRFFDWAPSLFYALGFAFFFLSFRSRTPVRNAVWVVIGAACYEALQALIPERTVDWMDFAATLLALPIAIAMYRLSHADASGDCDQIVS